MRINHELFGKESLSVLALSIGIVILVSFNVVSYQMLQHEREHMSLVKHSRQIIDAVGEILSAMKDAETGQRGYLLTGDPQYLEPYQTATKYIQSDLEALRGLVQGNAVQQRRSDQLTALIEQKLQELSETIQLRQALAIGAVQTLLHTDRGRHVMDDIRSVAQAMDQEERGFLQLRWDQQQLDAQREHRAVFFGSVTSMCFITLALIMFTREQERHKKVTAHLREMEHAQRAIRESEAVSSQRLTELLLLYDTAPVGLGFVDPDLRFVKVNEALAKINDKPMAEHVGRTVFDVLPEEVAKKVEALLRQTMATGRPLRQVELYGTMPHDPGNEHWWSVTCHPMSNSEGKLLGVHAVIEDITQQKQAQQQIERLNADLGKQIDEHQCAIRQLHVVTAALKEKNEELEQFHDIVVGRELKMIELEKELRKLQGLPK
jgi:PAS domain S-box-containing protein